MKLQASNSECGVILMVYSYIFVTQITR